MSLENSKVLITGAAGGIGSAIARRLAAAGAGVLLTDLGDEPLAALAGELEAAGAKALTVAADLTSEDGRAALAARAAGAQIDTLINVAGVNPFGLFSEQTGDEIERTIRINTLAPMLVCRALLPVLARAPDAHIVNIGSTFGAVGFPGFCAYSASKFAIRGFSESLRRELADTPIRVHYVAPRATRTALSTDRVRALNAALGIGMDAPETVARAVERVLVRSRRAAMLGPGEKVFALVNALAPGLVDRYLEKRLPVIRRHAARGPAGGAPDAPSRPPVEIHA